MLKLLLSFLVIFTLIGHLRAQETSFSARQLGQSMAQCFGGNELLNCMETKIFEALDQAIANNETWKMSDFLIVEKNSENHVDEGNFINKQAHQGPLSDKLASKILQLAQLRSLKIQLPSSSVSKLFSKRSISADVKDSSPGNGNNLDVAENVGAFGQLGQAEGRKRGHKDKNVAVMGGMAMLAMVAQMFLGKVILIAGAAFVMAKVALIVATLGSLKKGASGSPAAKEHVIVTTAGSGVGGDHSHEIFSGWHRRVPLEHNVYQPVSPVLQKFSEPIKYFEAADNNYYQKRHAFKNPHLKEDS